MLNRSTRCAAAAAMLISLLAVGGCRNGGAPDPGPSPTESPTDDTDLGALRREEQMPAEVTVKASGAVTIDWAGQQNVIVNRSGAPSLSTNLLSIGIQGPELFPQDPRKGFRWAFDLVGGYEDRPGTFTLTSDNVTQQGMRNLVFFVYARQHPDGAEDDWENLADFWEFTTIKQPCTLTIGGRERDGSLTCPEVADADGRTVAFTVTWHSNQDPQPIP